MKNEAGTWLAIADRQDDSIIITGVLQTTTTISSAILLAHAWQLELTGGHAPYLVNAIDDVDAAAGVVFKRLCRVEVPSDRCVDIRFAL